MEKNYGFQTRTAEIEYVKTFTSRMTPDGEINHKRYESLARDLNFMKAIITIIECDGVGVNNIDYKDYNCFIGLMSSIETMYQGEHIRDSFFNCMMNDLYNITLLTMSDEQYNKASELAEHIK